MIGQVHTVRQPCTGTTVSRRSKGSSVGWIDDVIGFWFEELTPRDWWNGGRRIDASIRARLGVLHAALSVAPPRPESLDAPGHLAVVIVFDQFPRNLFRRSAAAFATDALALAMALDAVDRDLDRSLPRPQRHFVYMPLMHSEHADLQQRSMALFERLGDPSALRSAAEHERTIARFGRFPERNDALGRQSTGEEIAFLARRSRPR